MHEEGIEAVFDGHDFAQALGRGQNAVYTAFDRAGSWWGRREAVDGYS
jgi:hypothetical protein